MAGELAGSALSTAGNLWQAKKQREWSENMWHMQNRYNSPAAQMERLRRAGLSTAMMYSGGKASTGNAGAPQPYQRANIDVKGGGLETLSMYQNIKNMKAQEENTKADTASKVTNELGKSLDNRIKVLDVDIAKIEHEYSTTPHRS